MDPAGLVYSSRGLHWCSPTVTISTIYVVCHLSHQSCLSWSATNSLMHLWTSVGQLLQVTVPLTTWWYLNKTVHNLSQGTVIKPEKWLPYTNLAFGDTVHCYKFYNTYLLVLCHTNKDEMVRICTYFIASAKTVSTALSCIIHNCAAIQLVTTML